MSNFKKRALAAIMVCIMMLTAIGSIPSENIGVKAANEYGLAANAKDGVILHAWCWSFNTIKDNMKLIAQAGYTSVQTSPINECLVGDNGALSFGGHWYYHYQPTNYTIGNYQLGTEAEFKAMCAEADKYGIKIIVDVVSNHMTSDYNSINSSWKNSSLYHTNAGINDWNSRYEVTQRALLGLWDLNTQSNEVQQRILAYLKQCIADGADGFRYDAAKHIELPDDTGFGGNYWPVILNNGAEFQYGEILHDSVSRDSAYAQYMSITASSFGYVVREQLAANNLSSDRLSQFYVDNTSPSKLVTWVESHDNYCDGVSTYMTNNDLRLAWAIVASKADGTPLFFSRPKGGGNGIMFPEQSRIGDIGDSLFYDNTIVAVNRFHNAMIGQSESMKNYNDNSCLIIERGNKGMVIVNSGGSKNINTSTKLANGTYTDKVSGSKFTVSNGYISGTVGSAAAAVLYNSDIAYEEPETSATSPANSDGLTVHFKRNDWGSSAPYIYAYTDNGTQVTAGWPGTLMSADTSEGNGWYIYKNSSFKSANIMFNMGASSTNRDPGDGQPGYPASGEVWYYNGRIYTSNPEPKVPETTAAPTTEAPTKTPTHTITYKDGSKTVTSVTLDENAQYTLISPLAADGKIFAGWFTREVSLTSPEKVKDALKYAAVPGKADSDKTIYAGWINISDGANAFELLGTQIRIDEPSGLRFVTAIGTNLISNIEALNSANNSLKPETASDKGIGYGTVVTMAQNIGSKEFVKDINAVYVNRGFCVVPALQLFEKTDSTIKYTAVVTGIPKSYYDSKIAARPYITYKNANGIEQTYYYTEANSQYGGGYAVSLYRTAEEYYNNNLVSSEIKEWLRIHIINSVIELV